jgi:hypothetical protein
LKVSIDLDDHDITNWVTWRERMKGLDIQQFGIWFVVFVAMYSIIKLEALGQPVVGILLKALAMAGVLSLFEWIRKQEPAK